MYQAATLSTSVNPVTWSSGINFDGYVLIMLSMPTGYSGRSAYLQGQNPVRPIAQRWRFFVVDGAIDQGSTIPYTASLEPPNTQYAAFWYDLDDQLIATAPGLFSVAASPYVLTAPTLTSPAVSGSVPSPGTIPAITGPGYSNAETPGGTLNGSNVTFTLANAPAPTASLLLIRNNMILAQGVDYTLSGKTITFTFAPVLGDVLRAWYSY